MRKLIASVFCFGMCAVIASAQGDAPKLEGSSWTAIALEFDGKKLPGEILEKINPVFSFQKGSKYVTSIMGKQDEAGTYKINAKTKPAQIDLMIEDGKDKGKTQVGLVSVEGDTLKVAFAKPGEKDRPKNFEGGEGFVIVTFKRNK